MMSARMLRARSSGTATARRRRRRVARAASTRCIDRVYTVDAALVDAAPRWSSSIVALRRHRVGVPLYRK